jgi:hypothetical protein
MKTNIHLWYLANFFLEWEMFQTKVVEKIKAHIFCSITPFFENRAVYEIMRKNTVELGRSQMAIWRRHITCWIPKAMNTVRIINTYTFFHCNNGCTKAHYYDIFNMPVLFCYRIAVFFIESLYYRDYTINSHIYHVRITNILKPSGTSIYHQLEH